MSKGNGHKSQGYVDLDELDRKYKQVLVQDENGTYPLERFSSEEVAEPKEPEERWRVQKQHSRVDGKLVERPANPDAEIAVLGAAFHDEEAAAHIADALTEKAFVDTRNREIFAYVRKSVLDGKAPDLILFTEHVQREGKENSLVLYTTDLVSRAPYVPNIRHHCLILRERQLERDQLDLGIWLQHKVTEGQTDPFDLLEEAEDRLYKADPVLKDRRPQLIGEFGAQVKDRVKLYRKSGGVIGLPTGYKEIDDITQGWQAKNYILAGASNMGKSILAQNFAWKQARENIPGAYFSVEMTGDEILERLVYCEAQVSADNAKEGKLFKKDLVRLSEAFQTAERAPLYVIYRRSMHIREVIGELRRLVRFKGVKYVVVDYLQRLHGDRRRGDNREREMAMISESLSELPQLLGIPVISLSMVGRSVQGRPSLTDLRESGAIENDADVVFAVYRPEYYGKQKDAEGRPVKGLVELPFLKNRGGKRNVTAYLTFLEEYMRFENGRPATLPF